MAGILVVTYLLSRVVDRSIFKLGVWCFTGFAALLPVVVAALFWKRSTKQGARGLDALGRGALGLLRGRGLERRATTRSAAPASCRSRSCLLVSAVAMVVVSLLTEAPEPARLARFFPGEPVRREERAA